MNTNCTFDLSDYNITGYTADDFYLGLTAWSGLRPNVINTYSLSVGIVSVDTTNKTVVGRASFPAAYGGTVALQLIFS